MREIWRYVWQDGNNVEAEFDTIQECGVFEAWTPVSMTELRREQALVGLDHKNVVPAGWPPKSATVHSFVKPHSSLESKSSTEWSVTEMLTHAINKARAEGYDKCMVILAKLDNEGEPDVVVTQAGVDGLQSMGIIAMVQSIQAQGIT